MTKEKLKSTSTEDLVKQQKTLKVVTWALAFVLLLLFSTTLYYSIKNQEFDTMIVVPLALSAIVVVNLQEIKSIQKEINSRNS